MSIEQPWKPEPPTPPPNTTPPPPPQPPKRRRRRWPWVILVLLLLLVGLVLLGPTIASTGAARSFVLGKVNQNLNGNVEISSWSLGWFSPISVTGIKVYDDQKHLVLDVPKVQLGISLMDAAKQNFNFGNDNLIEVASFDVRVDENGKSNLEKLVKVQPSTESTSATTAPAGNAQPSKIPNVTGQFTVNFKGTVQAANTPTVFVDPSSAVVKISDINKPIDNNVKLVYRIGDDPQASTVVTSGTVDAIENYQVDIDKLVAAEKIALQNVNLAAAEPFAKKSSPDMKVGGIANGDLSINAQGLTGISASGSIVVANLLFGGGPIGADQFKTEKLSIPINITRTVSGPNTIIEIKQLGAEMSQANFAVSGKVNEQALINLSKQQPPGSDGTLSIQANVIDLKDLSNQLRNTLNLDPSVRIDTGKITNDVAINFTADSVKAAVKVNADAKGSRANQPIELKPIALTFDATALPTGKPIPNVKDLKLNLNSDFMTITGGGDSLAKIDIKGKYDLGKLRDEAAQFTDVSKIQLQGTGDFAVNTTGDVTNADAPIQADATVNLQNVKIARIGGNQQIDQDRLAIVAGGKINRKDNAPIGVSGASVKLTAGDPAQPTLAMNATADVDLSKQISAPNWKFTADADNLAPLQKQYGGFVPALADNKIEIASGGFHIHGAGSYDGSNLVMSEPLEMSMPSLDIRKGGKTLINREVIRAAMNGSITLGQDRIGASLTQLSLSSQSGLINVAKAGDAPLVVAIVPSKNDISGSGTLTIASNVKRISDLAQSFSTTAPSADQPQLRSGQFNSTVVLTKADTTKIDFNGQLTNLTVASNGKNAIDNEQLNIALNAVAPNDLQGKNPITFTGKVGSSFINTTLSDVKVLLSAANILDMLQSATVDLQAPDMAKLMALAQAFSPPAATPAPAGRARPAALQQQPADDAPVSGNERISSPRAPRTRPPADRGDVAVASTEPEAPLEVTSGAASIKMNLTRDVSNKTTAINVTEMQINKLGLRRGDRHYDSAQPIAMKLNAQLTGDAPDKITLVKVDQLSGSAGFAKFQASQPVTISSPLSANPNLAGEFKADGSIDDALPLVSVLQGADRLPYSGKFDLVQKLSTATNKTTLVGAMNVNEFRAQDATRRTVFTEKQIAIRNDIGLDMTGHVASVNSLTIDMPQSQALGVKFNGQVVDWANARQIKGVNEALAKLNLSYDLEKLWPIIKPMLSPELQEEYAKLVIKGKTSREFTISGAMPANVPAGKTAFSQLNMTGALALDYLDLPQGLTFQAFELPFEMKNGAIRTQPARSSNLRQVTVTPNSRKPATRPQEVIAKTAVANEGALNLDGVVLELDKPDMPLTVIRKHVLLNDVRLNPVLADSLGKLGTVIMSDATKAEGELTITVVECDHVPIGDLLNKKTGKAVITIQIENLNLDGPVPKVLAQICDLGTEGIVGSIPPSTINLANGQATTDLTIQINRVTTDARTNRDVTRGLPLKFTGGLNLADLTLRNFMVDIPPEMILRDMRKIFPNGVAVPLTGTANKPQLNLQKLIQENAVKGLLGNVTGGDNKATDGKNSGSKNDNPLGNILDQLGGGNNNDRNQPAPRTPPRNQPNQPNQRNQTPAR